MKTYHHPFIGYGAFHARVLKPGDLELELFGHKIELQVTFELHVISHSSYLASKHSTYYTNWGEQDHTAFSTNNGANNQPWQLIQQQERSHLAIDHNTRHGMSAHKHAHAKQ